MQEAINIMEDSLTEDKKDVREKIPSFCFDCRNLKSTGCKKNMKPKGKFSGGLQCKRHHPKGN